MNPSKWAAQVAPSQFSISRPTKWAVEDNEFNVSNSQLEQEVSGVESALNICGGAACVAGTRIPVWVLEQCRQLGMSDTEILLDYPTLEKVDLQIAWKYVREHPEEIEREIRENQE